MATGSSDGIAIGVASTAALSGEASSSFPVSSASSPSVSASSASSASSISSSWFSSFAGAAAPALQERSSRKPPTVW